MGPEGLNWVSGVTSDAYLNMNSRWKSSMDNPVQSQSHVNNICGHSDEPLLMVESG